MIEQSISATLDIALDDIWNTNNLGGLLKATVSYGRSTTNGLIEDLGVQSNIFGGMFLAGGEIIVPTNPIPLPFASDYSSWIMTPGAGWTFRAGLGIDVPDASATVTYILKINGQTRDEIYDAINRNRIIEENENNSSVINTTPPNLDDIADFLQGLNSDLDNMDGLRGLGDVKLNTEASINGGWPNDNELTGSSNNNNNSSSNNDHDDHDSSFGGNSGNGSGSSSGGNSGGSGAGGGGWNADNELTVGDAGGSGGSGYCAANDNYNLNIRKIA